MRRLATGVLAEGILANKSLANGILTATLTVLLLLSYESVNMLGIFAHGGGTPRLINEPVGPYQIFAWSSPEPLRVGEIHLTFALILPPTGDKPIDETTLFNDLDQVVTGAEIDVQFVSMDRPGDQLKVKASPSSINPLYYETDAELPSAGNWQVTIDVSGELGDGMTTFGSVVEDAQLIDWKIVAGVGVAFLFLIYASRVRSMGANNRNAST